MQLTGHTMISGPAVLRFQGMRIEGILIAAEAGRNLVSPRVEVGAE